MYRKCIYIKLELTELSSIYIGLITCAAIKRREISFNDFSVKNINANGAICCIILYFMIYIITLGSLTLQNDVVNCNPVATVLASIQIHEVIRSENLQ